MDTDEKTLNEDKKYLEQLLRLGQTLNSTLEFEKVLNTAIELVVDFVKAQRGFIMMFNDEDLLEPKAVKNLEEEEILRMKSVSKTILDTTSRKGEKIISVNAQVDPRFKHSESVKITGLRSVMCVPIRVKEKIIGVIYLDNQIDEGRFNDLHLDMLEAFANQAAVAIENARLHENLIKAYEERIRLTLELHEQEKRRLASEEANRLKSEFVNIVAHELKSPLTVVKSYTSMLYEDFITRGDRLPRDIKQEIFETMDHQIDRLVNMVKKQLDTSRIDEGRPLSLELAEIDINNIVDEVVKLQNTSNFYLPDQHIIKKEIEENLPRLICDKEKTTQILYNLVENALKYSPEGGEVEIKVTVNDKFMHFDISDHGIGMSEEGQKKLFQKFQRIDTKGHAIRGTGLGLYLIKHLVELQGGEISVTSIDGEGSTFSFTIPLDLKIPEKSKESKSDKK